MPRWPHARGTLRLSRAESWERRRAAERFVREDVREERAQRAAQHRAWRRWRHAIAVADRIHALYGSPKPSLAAAAAWEEITVAARECAQLGIRGVNWKTELASAARRASELTPPKMTRADYRRQRREERKLARNPGTHDPRASSPGA